MSEAEDPAVPAHGARAHARALPPKEVRQEVDNDCDFPLVGVSLSFLRSFLEKNASSIDGLRSSEVCEKIVKPATARDLSRFVELPECRDQVAPATVFVSHAWHYHFRMFAGALLSEFEQAEHPEQVFLWIDLFR